ncbi:MAG TPA: type 1 glutamine amidotransferase domain-containing protein [Acetobacteraceae bacterium]|nr:type 1 glutamine amidotransferase domain-containing protein [Acetobacteraceae bacterium]
MARIAIIATSHNKIPGTEDATGVWYEELSAPYYAFRDAGFEVTIASIRGGEIPFDGRSLGETPMPESVQRFHEDSEALGAARASLPAGAIDMSEYDAVFLPGGHGAMWDFPESAVLASILAKAFEQRKIVAAVCHGPAAFVGAKRADGSPLIKGRSIACFTDSEERAVHMETHVPFLLEARLRDMGAQISTGPDFAPHIMEDGNLLTGQNPKSSTPLAGRVVVALRGQARVG